MSEKFQGFSEKTFSFFRQLKRNNNREWFIAHKEDYNKYVLDPAVAFVETFGEALDKLAGGIISYDTRTNGGGSIKRIYRDIRFSKDKTPYKTNLGIIFKAGSGKDTECPGYYFHMDSDQTLLYAGLYVFPKEILQKYRRAVDSSDSGVKLVKIIDKLTKTGEYIVGGDGYKKVPAGFPSDHPRAELLKYNTLYAVSMHLPKEIVCSPSLIDECLKHAKATLPLIKWLANLYE